MGFLDFLFKKKALSEEGRKAPEKTRIVSLSEALSLCEEKKRGIGVADTVPLVEEIRFIHGETASLVKELSAKKVPDGIDGYRIALNTKDEFEKRSFSLLSSLKFPSSDENIPKSLEEFVSFGKDLNRFLVNFAKTVSDNRYLVLFFDKDTKAIGEKINEMHEAAKAFGEKIAVKQGEADCLSELSKEIKGFVLLRNASDKERKTIEEIQNELARLKAEQDKAEKQLRSVLDEIKSVEAETAEAKRVESHSSQDILGILSPLSRPLRKFEKATPSLDKKFRGKITAYLEDPLTALENEWRACGDYPDFKRICGELKRYLDSVEGEERARKKAAESAQVALNGELAPLLEKILETQAKKTSLEDRLNELRKQEDALKKPGEKILEEQKALENAVSESARLEKRIAGERESVKQKISSTLGAELAE